jgi:hypothetical protein
MQVASSQAAKAFAALRAGRRRGAARRRRRPRRLVAPTTLDRALAAIDDLPPVRAEPVAAARWRVEQGVGPSSGDVADMVVRRAVADQLG